MTRRRKPWCLQCNAWVGRWRELGQHPLLCRACWDRGVPQVCYRYHGPLNKLPSDLHPEMKGRRDVIGPILKRLRSKG